MGSALGGVFGLVRDGSWLSVLLLAASGGLLGAMLFAWVFEGIERTPLADRPHALTPATDRP